MQVSKELKGCSDLQGRVGLRPAACLQDNVLVILAQNG
jgi:hypothetical protein